MSYSPAGEGCISSQVENWSSDLRGELKVQREGKA